MSEFNLPNIMSKKKCTANTTSKIVDAFENNEIACSIFLDFAKAFDTVNHNTLLGKLYNYGIRGMAQKWFRSYLFKRQQIVKINDNYSTPLEIMCGVPQGSVSTFVPDLHKWYI